MHNPQHHDSVRDFAELSSVLTGFTTAELYGTGVVQLYYDTLLDMIGERIVGRMLITWDGIRSKTPDIDERERLVEAKICSTPMMGPVSRNVIAMWYVGNWNQMPGDWRQKYGAAAGDTTRVISARAYQESLAWRTFDAHPPTAKQTGFGSWTRPPSGAPEIDDAWKSRA